LDIIFNFGLSAQEGIVFDLRYDLHGGIRRRIVKWRGVFRLKIQLFGYSGIHGRISHIKIRNNEETLE
jgi:hypothetical protein